MTHNQIRILLEGSDLKESWNIFVFSITATNLNNNISNSSYLFTVNTQPDCLDVKFSLSSSFQNTISYSLGSPKNQL